MLVDTTKEVLNGYQKAFQLNHVPVIINHNRTISLCQLFMIFFYFLTVVSAIPFFTKLSCDTFTFTFTQRVSIQQQNQPLSLSISLEYKPMKSTNYIDFTVLKKPIYDYLANHAKDDTYWEVINKKITEIVYNEGKKLSGALSGVKSELVVMPYLSDVHRVSIDDESERIRGYAMDTRKVVHVFGSNECLK